MQDLLFHNKNSIQSFCFSQHSISDLKDNLINDSLKSLFFLITNRGIYDVEYSLNNLNGNLVENNNSYSLKIRKEVQFNDIEFLSLTSDLKKLIIHTNNNQDINIKNGNFGLIHEKAFQIAICISSLIFNYNKKIIKLVNLPKSKNLLEKIKHIHEFKLYW